MGTDFVDQCLQEGHCGVHKRRLGWIHWWYCLSGTADSGVRAGPVQSPHTSLSEGYIYTEHKSLNTFLLTIAHTCIRTLTYTHASHSHTCIYTQTHLHHEYICIYTNICIYSHSTHTHTCIHTELTITHNEIYQSIRGTLNGCQYLLVFPTLFEILEEIDDKRLHGCQLLDYFYRYLTGIAALNQIIQKWVAMYVCMYVCTCIVTY